MESKRNWEADKRIDFTFTGITERRTVSAKNVKAGDLLFMYVPTPYCAFADIRIAVKDGIHRSLHTREYDVECYRGLMTAPLIALEEKQWVSLAGFVWDLSFARMTRSSSTKWGHAMRVSFRKLTRADGEVIIRKMAERQPNFDWVSVRAKLGLEHKKATRRSSVMS